jgi:hypothetical protein
MKSTDPAPYGLGQVEPGHSSERQAGISVAGEELQLQVLARMKPTVKQSDELGDSLVFL